MDQLLINTTQYTLVTFAKQSLISNKTLYAPHDFSIITAFFSFSEGRTGLDTIRTGPIQYTGHMLCTNIMVYTTYGSLIACNKSCILCIATVQLNSGIIQRVECLTFSISPQSDTRKERQFACGRLDVVDLTHT